MIKLVDLLEAVERDPKKWRQVDGWTARKIVGKGWHKCQKHDWVPFHNGELAQCSRCHATCIPPTRKKKWIRRPDYD